MGHAKAMAKMLGKPWKNDAKRRQTLRRHTCRSTNKGDEERSRIGGGQGPQRRRCRDEEDDEDDDAEEQSSVDDEQHKC